MADESAEWRITVRWPYTPSEETNYGLQYYLSHPDRLRQGVWGVSSARVESFEVRARTVQFVVTVTGVTRRPVTYGRPRPFQSSAQDAVDTAVYAACFAATLARLIKQDEGLPEPVRFEVRAA